MNLRRVTGFILALSLLTGSLFVPQARAACAVPKAKAACPSCSGGPSSTAAAVTVDRSCCAAPSSLSEREPATAAPDRAGDRSLADAVLLSTAAAGFVVAPTPSPRHAPALPGASPPRLRSTVLLI